MRALEQNTLTSSPGCRSSRTSTCSRPEQSADERRRPFAAAVRVRDSRFHPLVRGVVGSASARRRVLLRGGGPARDHDVRRRRSRRARTRPSSGSAWADRDRAAHDPAESPAADPDGRWTSSSTSTCASRAASSTRTSARRPRPPSSRKAEVTFLEETVEAKTIATFTKIRRQTLDDISEMASVINSDLAYRVQRRLVKEIVNGTSPAKTSAAS